ncbi:MAG TPA: DUF6588 family protein, partial [Balneolaceae bacterium]|nr:DUF6588 family protein [Balneolaceae bacterium]
HGALAYVPFSDRRFNVKNLNLKHMQLASGQSPMSPTAAGHNSPGPEVVVKYNGHVADRFNLPKGSGFHFAPSPTIQASVGLIKKTDLSVRYTPKVHIGSYGNFRMEGIALRHSISQWLPGGKFLPINIAIMAGYNHVNVDANLNLKPDPTALPDPNYSGNYNNQKVKDNFNTFTAQLIVGKNLPFISVYVAGGYEKSVMHLAVVGDYPVTENRNGIKRTKTITDPFSYKQDGINKYSLTGGFKFKLFFFHIFGQYTLAKYPVANAGIGLGFR